jgi:hypothetical protein
MAQIYKQLGPQEILEIQNWQESRRDKAMISRRLSPQEVTVFQHMRAAKASDSQIWMKLHPDWPRVVVDRIPPPPPSGLPGGGPMLRLEELTDEQMRRLLRQRVSAGAACFKSLERNELLLLLRGFYPFGQVQAR